MRLFEFIKAELTDAMVRDFIRPEILAPGANLAAFAPPVLSIAVPLAFDGARTDESHAYV